MCALRQDGATYLVSPHCRCQKPRSKPINRVLTKAYVKEDVFAYYSLAILGRAQRFICVTVFLDCGKLPTFRRGCAPQKIRTMM